MSHVHYSFCSIETVGRAPLVAEQPYESIRVRTIAELAGCNHGLITHYFGTKRGLFTRVLQDLANELSAAIPQHASARRLLDLPANAAFWRLLAALLEAGLDPAEALDGGMPAVDSIVRRASELSGRDLESSRALAGLVLVMVGGYHVFGDVFAATIKPLGTTEEAADAFERLLALLLSALSAE